MNTSTILTIGIVIIVLVLGTLFLVHNRYTENFAGVVNPQVDNTVQQDQKNAQSNFVMPYDDPNNKLAPIKVNDNVLPYPQMSTNYESLDDAMRRPVNPDMDIYNQPQNPIKAEDLLPLNDPRNSWNLSNPQVNGSLKDKNLLETGYLIGIDTVSNTLKNANLQIRSDPLIAQIPGITPWSNSTYGPDVNRKQFEIGGN